MIYQLIDSGDGQKLARCGKITIQRPAPLALWHPKKKWNADATFVEKKWKMQKQLPESWEVEIEGIRFKLKRTDFGHLGLFPEQKAQWRWLKEQPPGRVLNLFAYSGGSSLASQGEVTHLDAARGMVDWACENAQLNGREDIRWIVEDVRKFVKREVKRGNSYDGVILDPPTFGRGKSLEVFKIERDLVPLLDQVMALKPRFVLLSCHTPGYTPTILSNLLKERFRGEVEAGEMLLEGEPSLPSGAFARWKR